MFLRKLLRDCRCMKKELKLLTKRVEALENKKIEKVVKYPNKTAYPKYPNYNEINRNVPLL